MRSTNYAQEVIRRFLAPAIIKLGGLVPVQKRIESYDDYSLRCLELIASLLSGGGGGVGLTPGAGTVTTATIADSTITAVKIQDGNVTTAKIADAAITTEKIADGSIQTVDLADAAIVTAKLADNVITSAKIQDGAISTVDLGTAAVTTAKLADAAITSAKIADAAITSDKIADGAISTIDLADGSVTSAKILDGTILAIDIADGVITAAKLAPGAVGTASIPDSAITTIKIVDAAIDAAKLATNAVTTTKLVDGAVISTKIANDAITSGKIADGAIATADLADGAITAAKLAANAAVLSLNALKGDLLLVGGSNVVISATGQTFTINASNAVSGLTAPSNPYPGQVWFNIAGIAVSGIPAGNHGVWNGTAWISVGTPQPIGALLVLVSAPGSPLSGQTWFNISGAALSGIPAGNHGVWNGTTWVDVGLTCPSTVTAGSPVVGFSATNTAVLARSNAPGAHQLLILPQVSFDTLGGYNPATGIYTVRQQGNWLWEISCRWTPSDNGVDLTSYATINNVLTVNDIITPVYQRFCNIGSVVRKLANGDQIRFLTQVSAAINMQAGANWTALRVAPTS